MSTRNFTFNPKACLTVLLIFAGSVSVIGQYYYKDLLSIKQITDNYKIYSANKINTINLKSYQGNQPVTEGFICEQTIDRAKRQVFTYTKTADAGESYFTAFYNAAGSLVKTIDSSEESVSASVYQYDPLNRLLKLTHETHALDNSSSSVESHTWLYNSAGKPVSMHRVKNGKDSTTYQFAFDENGNVSEEAGFSKSTSSGKYYYYYDKQKMLTDIVRYNAKAKRLLPDYVFEYEENGALSTMMIVPEGSSDYQKWYYTYDDGGLKLADFCYNKKNELQGKIEYTYTAGR